MKKTLLLLSLFVAGIASAQKYVPFPTENAEWNINYTTGTYGFPTSSYLKQYSLHGDTVINNVTYQKLCTNIGTVSNPVYKGMGGLREQDKKIYYCGCNFWENFNSSSSEEVTLYDFNKVVGEEVKINNYTGYTITKIDSVKIGNSYRKRYNDRIIEGIGDVQEGLLGMITPRFTCMECIYNWQFICFSQNGESIYKNRDYVDCESIRRWDELPYVPFPSSNAFWREIKIQQGSCDHGCLSQYKMLGDTTINSVHYVKVYYQADTLSDNHTAVYTGALREDSKKLYFYPKSTNTEIRLYDFTKQVGDTLQNLVAQYLMPLTSIATITKIDSIPIDGAYRRAYHITSLEESTTWIEGIGSTHGLLVPFYRHPTCICAMDLLCFHQNNKSIYLNPTYSTCSPLLDGIQQVSDKPNISINPNPLSSSSILKWDKSKTFSVLNISDLLGKTIRTIPVSGLNEYSINRSDLSKGLFIVRLSSKDGKQETVKLIVE